MALTLAVALGEAICRGSRLVDCLQTNEGVDDSDGIACSTLYIVGWILCLLDRYPDLSALVQSCTVTWGRVL